MIEVLVALLLLSFTLLGIAGLLGATTKYQIGVESRSITTLFFTDLTSRLRSNLPNVPGYDVTNSTPAYVYTATWASQQGTIAAASTNCGPVETTSIPVTPSVCTSAQRAAFDLWETRSTVRRSLPQGSFLLAGDTTNGVTVTYMWFDKDYLTGTNPPTLQQSAICSATTTREMRQSCCPAAAAVGTTPGVRCLNLTFVP